jgi:hypothetical protein
MRSKSNRGVAFLEFSLVLLVLVPMLLGTTAIGLNMLRTLETIQVARDAGHMYAKGADFSQPGIQTIIAAVGAPIGLTASSTTSSAAVILSTVTFIDLAMCQADGKVDSHGNPLGCTNFNHWVFTQRLVIGKASFAASRFGGPLVSGPDPVVVNSTTGKISLDDQVTNAGDVATFTGINPYAVVDGNVSGLPSGEVIYVAEVLSTGITMAPFVGSSTMYSYNMF